MTWNITPECISCILLSILIFYYSREAYTDTIKYKVFRIACYAVIFAVAANLLSFYMIYNLDIFPKELAFVVITVCYIITPLLPLLYMTYIIIALYYNNSLVNVSRKWCMVSIPYLLYLSLLVSNIFLHNIFSIYDDQGYIREKYYIIPYFVFYFYCAFSIFLVMYFYKIIDRKAAKVLMAFPVISFAFIIIQFFFQQIIITDIAAFTSLLILFLYLQDQRIIGDELTGLLNKRTLINTLQAKIKTENEFCLLLLSLSNFKTVNNRFGTSNGDYLLRMVADYLRSIVKTKWLFRYEGDQFLVLLDDNGERAKIIEQIEQRFTYGFKLKNIECSLGAQIILVTYPLAGDSPEALLSALDYSLQYAKENGKSNQIIIYEKSMRGDLLRQEQVSELIEDSLKNDGFEVYYQPVWMEDNNCILGAEALLRMKPTPIGLIFPDEFITIAEKTGQIVEITYKVIESVCRDLNRLDKEGLFLNAISVNLSFLQFMQTDFVYRVNSILHKTGINPSRLKFEITERTLILQPDVVSECMHDCNSRGISFCLDDFGTGYSNLDLIMNLPFEIIKFDKSLITNATSDNKQSVLMKCFIDGLHAIGMSVVVEGVETLEQYDTAREWKCDAIQGFLLAKPMPIDLLIKFLHKNTLKEDKQLNQEVILN